MTQTKEVEKTEKSRDSPSPQKEKTLFPSKITYVALPLSQSNIIPHQHRSKSTLHTDNSRFALHIDISRNVSNAQIAIADINSRFKSSRASD